MLQGGKNVEVDAAVPGDIAAVAKVDEIEFDCVLHDSHDEDHIHMQPLAFPTPMQGVALRPKKRGDEQRIWEVLHRMTAEDPTLVVEHDPHSNETVLRALGELHLRSVLERMSSQFKLEIETRPPRIPYRETITAPADGFHRHKKQTGGAGQFGEVSLRVEPMARGTGFEFVDSTKGGVIPHQFMPAVRKGVEQVLGTGAIAGFPMHDVRVVVYDGKHHPVDSKEVAFVAAGRKAFLDAIEKARPIVLEPIVTVEVICPDVKTGDIAGDLSSRRGQVTGTKGLQPGHPRRQRARAAGRARRLFGAPEVGDRRAGELDDATVALRAGAAQSAAAARDRIQEVAQAGRRLGRAGGHLCRRATTTTIAVPAAVARQRDGRPAGSVRRWSQGRMGESRVNLTHHFLIAMPSMADPHFAHTLIYVCEHNEKGALGIVINKPIDMTLSSLFEQIQVPLGDSDLRAAPVHYGGPVQIDRGFVLHRPLGSWQSTLAISDDLGLTTSKDILEAVGHGEGPQDVLVSLGYAGWSADQLEQEIAQNAWLTVEADPDVMFALPAETRLSAAMKLLGIDFSRLSDAVGHA